MDSLAIKLKSMMSILDLITWKSNYKKGGVCLIVDKNFDIITTGADTQLSDFKNHVRYESAIFNALFDSPKRFEPTFFLKYIVFMTYMPSVDDLRLMRTFGINVVCVKNFDYNLMDDPTYQYDHCIDFFNMSDSDFIKNFDEKVHCW